MVPVCFEPQIKVNLKCRLIKCHGSWYIATGLNLMLTYFLRRAHFQVTNSVHDCTNIRWYIRGMRGADLVRILYVHAIVVIVLDS